MPPDSQGDRRLGPPYLLRSYRLQGRHHAPGSVLNILLTLISYTPLRCVRNVAREE